jgi:hypothetical protein
MLPPLSGNTPAYPGTRTILHRPTGDGHEGPSEPGRGGLAHCSMPEKLWSVSDDDVSSVPVEVRLLRVSFEPPTTDQYEEQAQYECMQLVREWSSGR